MGINNILSILSLFLFIPYFLLGNSKGSIRRSFLKYVLIVFPLLDLFITPLNYGGFSVFHGLTFIFILFLIILGKIELLKFSSRVGLVFFFLIIPILLIGALTSMFVQNSIIELVKYSFIFIYAKLLIDECFENPKFIKEAVYYIKIATIISLLFLLSQIIFSTQIALYDLNSNVSRFDSITRYPSYFADAQIYGQFLAISGLLMLANLINPKSHTITFYNLFVFAASTVGLFLTGSRAAFLGFILAIVFIFIFSNTKFRSYSLLAAGIMSIPILFFYQNFALFNRGANITETADLRFFYWQEAFNIFSEFPLIGIGIGNYKNYVSLYSQEQYWAFFGEYLYLDHPENGYLKILVELGALGFIILSGFLIRPLIISIHSFLYPQTRNSRLVIMVSAVLCWMVAFITVYSLNDIRIFILITTLVCLIISEKKKILTI